MEITRRSDYAFRILRAAYRHSDGYVSILEVAEEENIPYAFARTIQHDLAAAGFLRTIRGAKGGLMLDVDPAEVTLLEIMRTLQGPMEVAHCAADPSICSMSSNCTFNKIWIAASAALDALFGSLTLKDVLEGSVDGTFLNDASENAMAVVNASVEEILAGRAPITCEKVAVG